jgi:hypothetical protein
MYSRRTYLLALVLNLCPDILALVNIDPRYALSEFDDGRIEVVGIEFFANPTLATASGYLRVTRKNWIAVYKLLCIVFITTYTRCPIAYTESFSTNFVQATQYQIGQEIV